MRQLTSATVLAHVPGVNSAPTTMRRPISAVLGLIALGACGGRPTHDAGSVRRDGGVDANLEGLDAPGLDAFAISSDLDAGDLNVASCLSESLCDEFHDYPSMLLADEEAECAEPSMWSLEPCEELPDVTVAGGCRVDFGDSHYYISWYRSPEFMPSDVELICMTAGFPFVPAP